MAAWTTALILKAVRWCTCASPAPRRWIRFATGLAQQGIGQQHDQSGQRHRQPECQRSADQPRGKGRGSRSARRRQDGHPERPARHAGRGRSRQAGFQRRWADDDCRCSDAQGSAGPGRRRRRPLSRNSPSSWPIIAIKNRRGVVTESRRSFARRAQTPAVIAALARFVLHQHFRHHQCGNCRARKWAPNCAARRLYVTLYALAGMLVYIAFRFEWVYGAAAVLAVFHDVLITLGLFSIFHFEISLTVIAALLTLVGYSMNDTIVIFDRIRENSRLMRREPFHDDRESFHQSDAFAHHSDQRPDVPDRPGTVPDGRPGVARFFLCVGGWNSGRNVFKFRHCRALGGGLEPLERPGRGGSSIRNRSRH